MGKMLKSFIQQGLVLCLFVLLIFFMVFGLSLDQKQDV